MSILWKEITGDPTWGDLEDKEKLEIRDQYFEDFYAPEVQSREELDEAYAFFSEETAPDIESTMLETATQTGREFQRTLTQGFVGAAESEARRTADLEDTSWGQFAKDKAADFLIDQLPIPKEIDNVVRVGLLGMEGDRSKRADLITDMAVTKIDKEDREKLATILRGMNESINIDREEDRLNADDWSFKNIVSMGVGGAMPSLATGMLISAITKNPVAGGAAIGGQMYGVYYNEGISDKKLSPEEARDRASVLAAAEIILGTTQLKWLEKPAKSFLGNMTKSGAAETLEETAAEILNIAYDTTQLGDDVTVGEALNQMALSGAAGFAGGFPLGLFRSRDKSGRADDRAGKFLDKVWTRREQAKARIELDEATNTTLDDLMNEDGVGEVTGITDPTLAPIPTYKDAQVGPSSYESTQAPPEAYNPGLMGPPDPNVVNAGPQQLTPQEQQAWEEELLARDPYRPTLPEENELNPMPEMDLGQVGPRDPRRFVGPQQQTEGERQAAEQEALVAESEAEQLRIQEAREAEARGEAGPPDPRRGGLMEQVDYDPQAPDARPELVGPPEPVGGNEIEFESVQAEDIDIEGLRKFYNPNNNNDDPPPPSGGAGVLSNVTPRDEELINEYAENIEKLIAETQGLERGIQQDSEKVIEQLRTEQAQLLESKRETDQGDLEYSISQLEAVNYRDTDAYGETDILTAIRLNGGLDWNVGLDFLDAEGMRQINKQWPGKPAFKKGGKSLDGITEVLNLEGNWPENLVETQSLMSTIQEEIVNPTVRGKTLKQYAAQYNITEANLNKAIADYRAGKEVNSKPAMRAINDLIADARDERNAYAEMDDAAFDPQEYAEWAENDAEAAFMSHVEKLGKSNPELAKSYVEQLESDNYDVNNIDADIAFLEAYNKYAAEKGGQNERQQNETSERNVQEDTQQTEETATGTDQQGQEADTGTGGTQQIAQGEIDFEAAVEQDRKNNDDDDPPPPTGGAAVAAETKDKPKKKKKKSKKQKRAEAKEKTDIRVKKSERGMGTIEGEDRNKFLDAVEEGKYTKPKPEEMRSNLAQMDSEYLDVDYDEITPEQTGNRGQEFDPDRKFDFDYYDMDYEIDLNSEAMKALKYLEMDPAEFKKVISNFNIAFENPETYTIAERQLKEKGVRVLKAPEPVKTAEDEWSLKPSKEAIAELDSYGGINSTGTEQITIKKVADGKFMIVSNYTNALDGKPRSIWAEAEPRRQFRVEVVTRSKNYKTDEQLLEKSIVEAQGMWLELESSILFRDKIRSEKTDETGNSNRTILSLFDLNGTWVQPWADAGYNVVSVDIQNGIPIHKLLDYEFLSERMGIDGDFYAIFAACPCTDFTSTNAKDWKKKDADGSTEASKDLVFQTMELIQQHRPAMWVLENPAGRIQELTGLPNPRMSFQPHLYGHPYTKKTLLWGNFNADLPIFPVDPVLKSVMHLKYGGKSIATKNLRSKTPESFAAAFFKANDHNQLTPAERLKREYPEARNGIDAALEVGVDEDTVRNFIEERGYDHWDNDSNDNIIEDLVVMAADFKKEQEAKKKPDIKTKKSERKPKEETKPAETIEDFGEELLGAKKHLYGLREMLDNKDSDFVDMPLSKIWPTKLVDEIENPEMAAVAHMMRSEIPTKPRVARKKERWANTVRKKMNTVLKVQEYMAENPDWDMMQMLRENNDETVANKVELMIEVPREQWNRIGSVTQYTDSKTGQKRVSVYLDGRAKWFDAIGYMEIGMEVKEMLKAAKPKKNMKFEVRVSRHKNKTFINKKGDKLYRELVSFDGKDKATVSKAFTYINENPDQLEKKWEEVKARDNINKADLRAEGKSERKGTDWRKGKDVTTEKFGKTFGFRGVQFGNWVGQGKGAKERQGLLNQAYDSLMDLAEIMGIPPKALSLDGQLGLAFGARGKGGKRPAAAHYEPGNVVINLTKNAGAGTLAHEWFHALDNYFGKAVRGSYLTEYGNLYYENKNDPNDTVSERTYNGLSDAKKADFIPMEKKIRREVLEGFRNLVITMAGTGLQKRSASLDSGTSKKYWNTELEKAARSFENYVQTKLLQAGKTNDFLVELTPLEALVAMGKNPDMYPYLTPEEIPAIEESFDQLFKELKTKETDTGVALYSTTDMNNKTDVQYKAGRRLSGKKPVIVTAKVPVFDAVNIANAPVYVTPAVANKMEGNKDSLPDMIRDPDMVVRSVKNFGETYIIKGETAITIEANQDGYYQIKSIGKLTSGGTIAYIKDGYQAPDSVRSALYRATGTAQQQSVAQSQVERMNAQVKAEFPDSPVTIVADENGLPDGVGAKIIADGKQGMVRGIFYKGEIYIVASAHTGPNDVYLTLLHETVGHYGVKRLLGDKAHSQFLKDLFNSLSDKEVKRLIKRHGINTGNSNWRDVAAEEYIAEMAEKDINDTAFKKFVAMLRQFLRDNLPKTFGNMRISDTELQVILQQSKRNLQGKDLSGVKIRREVVNDNGKTDVYEADAARVWSIANKRLDMANKLLDCLNG